MSTRPAKILGLDTIKGSIAVGFQADLVIWNPSGAEKRETQDQRGLYPSIAPAHGQVLFGNVCKTYVRGRLVYDSGSYCEPVG
jgi:dihydroorotase-like cyclic amidohydrolase